MNRYVPRRAMLFLGEASSIGSGWLCESPTVRIAKKDARCEKEEEKITLRCPSSFRPSLRLRLSLRRWRRPCPSGQLKFTCACEHC